MTPDPEHIDADQWTHHIDVCRDALQRVVVGLAAKEKSIIEEEDRHEWLANIAITAELLDEILMLRRDGRGSRSSE